MARGGSAPGLRRDRADERLHPPSDVHPSPSLLLAQIPLLPPTRPGEEGTAFQNAKKYSDRQNVRIEHDKALVRVMTAVLKDDAELFKQFSDNDSFRKWLADTVFALTYQ